jgi:hypothetical protein
MFMQLVAAKKIKTPGVINGITAGKLFQVPIIEILHGIAQTGSGKKPVIFSFGLKAQRKN